VEDTNFYFTRTKKNGTKCHHGVRITGRAIVASRTVKAIVIYRIVFLPDKAIDLVDEAAAKLRMEIDSMPEELDNVERRIKQIRNLSVKRLKREKDSDSKYRLEEIEHTKLADLESNSL